MSAMALPCFSAEWLTRERLRVYPRILLTIYILAILSCVLTANGDFDSQGRPLGTDFTSFYTAAHLAFDG